MQGKASIIRLSELTERRPRPVYICWWYLEWKEREWLEKEEDLEGENERNYQYGPRSAKQVIAVDNPVCHTVNLSLSPGPLQHSAPYLYTAQSVCIGKCTDTISVPLILSLSLSRSLAVELCYEQDMSSHDSPGWCSLHVLIFPIVNFLLRNIESWAGW